jgi:zinc protease
MLENLLGEGIGSKLWPLRSEMNLAYNLKAKAIQMRKAGILWVYLKTDNSRKEKASDALTKILTDLYQNGVSAEEFAATKIRTRAYFLRSN